MTRKVILIGLFLIVFLRMSFASLVGVMLTTGKDTRVFEKSVQSAMKYLVDVEKYYVITPDAKYVKDRLHSVVGNRVTFVDENSFPFSHSNVSEIMIQAVKDKGVYPLSGNTPFERTVWGRTGWFLQQLLKLYAGVVLNLEDYVLLDSDIVWFQNITFLNSTNSNGTKRYNYASSSQYHPPYMSSLTKIAGVPLYEAPDNVFRSGICHHIVIVKNVLEDLMNDAVRLHGGIPFWQVLLNESALEMTCRAPREAICGAGSTLSEYELYYNYARSKHPETVNLRPLLWANGPAPGLQYWPGVEEGNGTYKIHADRHKQAWLGHRQSEVMRVLETQIAADGAQGYDYVGYHGYSKRRYYEIVQPDADALCPSDKQPHNTTCSWRGFDERLDKTRSADDWFHNCACYMMNAW